MVNQQRKVLQLFTFYLLPIVSESVQMFYRKKKMWKSCDIIYELYITKDLGSNVLKYLLKMKQVKNSLCYWNSSWWIENTNSEQNFWILSKIFFPSIFREWFIKYIEAGLVKKLETTATPKVPGKFRWKIRSRTHFSKRLRKVSMKRS